jgi:hypothetical protein
MLQIVDYKLGCLEAELTEVHEIGHGRLGVIHLAWEARHNRAWLIFSGIGSGGRCIQSSELSAP